MPPEAVRKDRPDARSNTPKTKAARSNTPSIQERARWWSHRRQRLGGWRAPDAGEALGDVVGVYSSHPTAPLSLHARTRPFDRAAFSKLEAEGLALRLPAMRSSIFLLPRENAHAAFRATAAPASTQLWRVRDAGIPQELYADLRRKVLEAARTPRTARELRVHTGAERSLTPILQMMTLEGVLLRFGARALGSNTLRYVAAGAWLGGPLPQADADAALARLAEGYLRAFGPAKPEDFRWWAGVAAGRASAALASVETVEVGDGYLLPAADLEAFEALAPPRAATVDLLPKWDCYTMGYAPDGRARFASEEARTRIYTPAGDDLGVVLVDGAAAGTWVSRFAGDRMEAEVEMFEAPEPRLTRAVVGRLDEAAALLGARTTSYAFPPRTPGVHRSRTSIRRGGAGTDG